MKKVLSLILAVCMLASFAMVASAAPSGVVLDVVEGETTVTATVTFKGDMENVNVMQAIVTYDPTAVTLTKNDIDDNIAANYFPEGWVNNSAQKKATATLVTYQVKAGEGKGNTANYLPAGTDFVLATLTFDKVAGATVEAGDIVIVEKNSFKPNIYTETYVSGAQNKLAAAAITNNFTAYVPDVQAPAVEVEGTDAEVAVDGDKYTVTVTAPAVFGKTYVVKANGEVINAGVEYTATEDVIITVELVDDTTKALHTYTKAYAAADEAAVFAKVTTGATEYGFRVPAFEGNVFTDGNNNYFRTAKFAANGSVDGVFGIKLTGIAAGSYEAIPYADGVEGDPITIVVE